MKLDVLRHSTSHIMAAAIKELYPDAKLGIGPSIENGFYYDFDLKQSLTDEDLPKIEKQMEKIASRKEPFEKKILKKAEAIKLFKKLKEPYKVELIENLPDEEVSIYTTGKFTDLCRGPHAEDSSEIKVFKLLSVAGAYWHGIETNPMLQRIYGTAFPTAKDLKKFLHAQEEAKKRDHRKLGPELDYFSFQEEIGPGLVLYHPKGAMVRSLIEDWEKREHLKRGYQLVVSPHIMKSDTWIKSGHYDYYKDNMFIFNIDKGEYALKPMNCPGHIMVYKSKTRSWRDLPFRLFELGSVYRNEKSGVLHGLLRVRGFTQDDAHIFCLQEQLTSEIKNVIDFVADALKVFGFEKWEVEVSTRPEKSIGSDEDWALAQQALEASLKEKNIKYDINEGEGAFYGPKIDIKLKDALGRSWQCATIQCDFALPERFDLAYAGKDGREHRPIMIHRVILGSMERFLGALLEHHAGALPLWLAPSQVRVLPVTEDNIDYAQEVAEKLRQADIRVESDLRNEKISYKIRAAQLEKLPYMLVVGARETENKTIAVRERLAGDQGAMDLDKFIKELKQKEESHQ